MFQRTTSSLAPSGERVILLTGFDPFGGDTVNPSWRVAEALHGQRIGGHRVVAAQLPTVFGPSLTRLAALGPAFRAGDASLQVTTSIGIATGHGSATTAEALLKRADSALYAAKGHGRDTFEIAI